MADVTFRLAWSNLVTLSGSVITASSEQQSFPVRNLRLPSLTNQWRSAYGWQVVAGFNDKIDFVEGGVTKVATITPGNYSTGALYAAAVMSAMNAVASANTYSVTYSTTTHLFTLTRSAGVAAISVQWLTGANVVTAASGDLGFTADDSGNTTYVGDVVAYQSKQFILIDVGYAGTAGSAHLFGLSLGNGATIKIQGNAANVWTAPSVSQTLSNGTEMSAGWFTSVAYRYWRVVISDFQNAAGFTSVKSLVVAPYLQLSRQVQRGYGRGAKDTTSVVMTAGGGMIQSKRVAPISFGLPFRKLTRPEMLALEQIQTSHGVGRPMVVSLDPQNRPTDAMYMALTSPLSFQHSHGDGNPPERWATSMELMQVTG